MDHAGPIGYDCNKRERLRLIVTIDLITALDDAIVVGTMHHLVVDHWFCPESCRN